MKMKRILALAICLALCLSLIGPAALAAGDIPLTATAEKDGDTLTVAITVAEDVPDIYAMALEMNYDHSAFEAAGITSPVDDHAQWGSMIVLDVRGNQLAAGDTIAVLSFHTTDNYVSGSQYSFEIAVNQALDTDGADLPVSGTTVKYQEPTTTFHLETARTAEKVTLTISVTDAVADFYGATLSVKYDTAAFTQGGISSPIDRQAQWSKFVVLESGTGSLSAGETIAVLTFLPTENFQMCYEYAFSVHTEEAISYEGDDLIIPDAAVTLPGHDWSEPTYEWAEDNSAVTATRICNNDASHVETETVNTTSEVTKAATCEEKGQTTYTAVFTNAAFETQSKTIDNLDALGHNWGEATYTWADDYSTVTATRSCNNDASHVETETVNTTSEITKPATCEAKGETTYTAAFANAAFETQSKTVENVDALGHDWSEATYTWAEDYSTVTATRSCNNDASHVETETVNTTSEVTKAATCDAKGETTYTATFTNAAFEKQTQTVENLDALGHDWDEPTFTWADDNSTVTATRVCKHDASHDETETADTTYEVVKAPTIAEEGVGRYTAVFNADCFATQTKDVPIEKLHGFPISIEDHTKGNAVCDIDTTALYYGEENFTVSADTAVLVAVRSDAGIKVLPCTTDAQGNHSFKVDVQEEVTIVLVFKGDVNLDGKVALKDNLMIKKHIAGVEEITDPLGLLIADVNGDGAIKLKDNLMIKKHIAGVEYIPW